MNNILTSEESAQVVTYGELAEILRETCKMIVDIENQQDKDAAETLEKIMSVLADMEYKRVRDVRFCMKLISDYGYLSYDKLLERYNKWCEEYDAKVR